MTIRHSTTLLSALCALAGLSGCSTVPAPQAPLETTKFTVENTERFVALDPAAACRSGRSATAGLRSSRI